jgi:membrane-associated protease RseP (regulator of RpoE activity)
MRKFVLTTVALLPLLLRCSSAEQNLVEQNWNFDASQPYGISSEDSGGTSYLGVDIVDIGADRLGALKLKEEQGVEVTMVDQDAPAGKAGIKEHDVIVSMNGTAVESKSQLQRMIHETPAGRVVSLGLSRDGQPLTIKVQLGDRKSEFAHMGRMKDDFHVEIPPIPPMPPMPNMDFDVPNIGVVYVHSSMRSGIMVENLTPQLCEFFGAKNGSGVLVRSVEKGSRADKAGLRAGDVIVKVGDQPVHDTSDFTHALHTHSAGSVTVNLLREKKEQTITLTLPQRKESGEMLEESFEAPILDADTQMELSEVSDEIARLQPQLLLSAQESVGISDQVCKSLSAQQKQIQKQARKLSKELGPKMQEELLKSHDKIQQEMKQLHIELGRNWLDI